MFIMKSINELKSEVMYELEKATQEVIPEIQGIQLNSTNWPDISSLVVQFKQDKGFATALLGTDVNGNYKLLAPFDVKINKEEKKK